MRTEVGADAAVPTEFAKFMFDIARMFAPRVAGQDETKVAGVP